MRLPFKIDLEDNAEILDFIEIGKGTYLIIQKREFKDKKWIDIRKYVITTRYQGFTKKGIAIELKTAKTLGEKLLRIRYD